MARTASMTAEEAAALLGAPSAGFKVDASNRNLARKFAVAYGMTAIAAGAASNATLTQVYVDACRRDPALMQAALLGVSFAPPKPVNKSVDEATARRIAFEAVNALQSGLVLDLMRKVFELETRAARLEAEIATIRKGNIYVD